MAARPLPSPEILRQLLRYEPETGKLFWKERPYSMFKKEADALSWNRRLAGKEAFTADGGRGYKISCVNGKMLKAHRVAWAIFYGEWPPNFIDHINQDRADNRISNLRLSNHVENSKNARISLANKSGRTGVHWNKTNKVWRAKIGLHGKKVDLGSFTSFDEAAAARENAERKLGYSKRHGSKR